MPATPWLAGSVSGLPFAELLRLLAEGARSGELTLTIGDGGCHKTLWLRDGEVVFAASSDPADRLDAVLWRRGLVPLATLERLAPRVGPERPLGQVLVDEGVLTPGALWDALVVQVREIALGAFHERRGTFLFHDGPAAPGGNEVRLPERTLDLVAAGLRRRAELEALAGEVPDPDAPLRAPGAPRGLDARAARLLACAAGAASAREAFRASGLGFHEGMKVLAVLAREGLVGGAPAPVALAPAAAPAEPDAESPDDRLETYRRALKVVYFRAAHATPAARARLNSWFDRLAEPDRALFDGVRVDAQGEVDVARVLVNVFAAGREEGPAARARALAALDALLAFALFEAKNLLPRDDAESLAREVADLRGRRNG